MSSEHWGTPAEPEQPSEAHAPPESARPVFGEVPGEAPTADLSNPAASDAEQEQPALPDEPQPLEPPAEEQPAVEQAPAAEAASPAGEHAPPGAEQAAPEPAYEEPVAQEPEPLDQGPEPSDIASSEPAAEAVPPPGPDADAVAGDGHGPAPQPFPSATQGAQQLWERPEVLLGAAFVGGLLIAALLRRRR